MVPANPPPPSLLLIKSITGASNIVNPVHTFCKTAAMILNAGTTHVITKLANVENALINRSKSPLFANAIWKLLLNSANFSLDLFKASAILSVFLVVESCCSSPILIAFSCTRPNAAALAATPCRDSSAAAAVLILFKLAGPSTRPMFMV